jgi:hypothetical protein
MKAVERVVKFYVKQGLSKASEMARRCGATVEAANVIRTCYTPYFPDPKTIQTLISKACDRKQGANVCLVLDREGGIIYDAACAYQTATTLRQHSR